MTTMIVSMYAIYAIIGTSVAIWVARKLDIHGATFAKQGDRYDSETGPAMSHLLVVGFSLVAFGVVSLALGIGSTAQTIQQCVEALSSKLGWVIMIIGLFHFLMLAVFAAMGRKSPIPQSPLNPSMGSETPTSTVAELVHRLHPHE